MSIYLNCIRNLALVGAYFSPSGGDSASCPYRRSPLLLQELASLDIIHPIIRLSRRGKNVLSSSREKNEGGYRSGEGEEEPG